MGAWQGAPVLLLLEEGDMTELSGPITAPGPPTPPADLSQLPPPPAAAPPEAPWYRRRRWLIALVAVAVVAALFLALRGGDGDGDAIEVPGGQVLVESVEVGDSYPAGCEPSPGCWKANSGFELVSVALLIKGDVVLSEPTLTVRGGGSFEVAITTTSVGDDDGERSVTLTFAVPEGARGYVLHLPGADPHEL